MNKKMRELMAKIQELTSKAKSLNEEKSFDEADKLLKEIDSLTLEYAREEKLFKAEQMTADQTFSEVSVASKNELSVEEKAFLEVCKKGIVDKTLSYGSNGAIIPKTIASKIIDKVIELSPIVAEATRYNVKGNLSIPTYGKDGSDDIVAAYATEFSDLTAHQGKFTSVDLTSILVGALSKISSSLLNNTDVDVLDFIIMKMAQAFAVFFEKELLVGTGATGHITGATTTTNTLTAAGKVAASITADLLIDMQLTIPQIYQPNAKWTMNKAVFKTIRKLKDGDGNYLVIKDFVAGSGFLLLGKPVSISENMPSVDASTVPVLYGDMSGMAFKIAKELEINVLKELYAAQHAVGIVGYAEVDGKIENSQKFVSLTMAAS